MVLKDVLAIVAALIAIAGNVPYLAAVVRGRVKPHMYTWLVGAIVSGIVFFGMFEKGAGIGALPIAVSEFFTILIFLFSLKYGFVGATKADGMFLVVALAALVPWLITKDPTLSIIMAVAIDVVSLVPTFRKTWLQPATEHASLYSSNVARHVLILFSLQSYNVATMLHSIVMICTNTAMTLIIFLRGTSRTSELTGDRRGIL